MMPMSQIDMVVFKEATPPQASTLEVCGKFERRPGNAAAPTKGQVFVVVRQGDFIAALHGPTRTTPAGSSSSPWNRGSA
jgi:hypothetical protein